MSSVPVTLNRENATKYSLLQSVKNTDFINNYYALSEEPLNLRSRGQRWFNRIYRRESLPEHSVGLILGGTPWMGTMVTKNLKRSIMVDINPAMLETAKREIETTVGVASNRVEYVCANWLAMPEFTAPIDVVVGDHCLNFLKYPDGWLHFMDHIVPKLSPHAKVIIRFCAIPPNHKSLTIEEIVNEYLSRDSITYTEVRAHLMLAHWEPEAMAIRTERLVDVFDAHEPKFEPLFRKFPKPDNDLITIRKFRNSGFVSYAPRLDDVLMFLSTRFRVTAVYFGPYGLAEYFPIIVGELR